MINSAQKDRVIAVLKKYGFVEQRMTKELFIIPDGRKISADLRGEKPIIGVEIAGMIHATGHGINAVQDIQNEVAAAMKFKSSASEQKGSNPASGGINKGSLDTSAEKKASSQAEPIPGESKLGAGDTQSKSEVKHENNSNINTSDEHNYMTGQPRDREIKEKGGQESPPLKNVTATCEGCSTKMQGSIVEFQEIEAKYNGIYCPDCVTRDKYLEKAKTSEASADQKVARSPATPVFDELKGEFSKRQAEIIQSKTPMNVFGTPAKPDIKAPIIKTCGICGLELSGARALECFEKDPQKPRMICEGCENNHDEAKHQEAQKEKDEETQERKARPEEQKVTEKIMDEKLPEVIKGTENKLTVNTIKQYICPTATDAEAYNFLQLCLHRDLNPFLKEAYLIKYGTQPATMVVGKDAFTRKAEESGKLDGYEAGIIVLNKDKQIERRVGVVQYEGDVLVGGWAKVYRKDMKYPFVTEVPLNEYIKRKPDGTPQSSWGIMPGTMIRKVALVQDLREAFTKELGGCYDAVEMGAQDNLK